MDIEREPVGVFSYLVYGIVAVSFINPEGARGTYAVGLQKDHDLPYGLLSCPCACNALHAAPAYAGELKKPFRVLFDDVKDPSPKALWRNEAQPP